jgi:hypothetical protein
MTQVVCPLMLVALILLTHFLHMSLCNEFLAVNFL